MPTMDARLPDRVSLLRYRQVSLLLLVAVMLIFQPLAAKEYGDVERQRIESTFPQVDSVSGPQGDYSIRTIYSKGEVVGYAFQSLDVVDIPAYSGKPVNIQVLMDTKGVIQDAYVLEHHEPILLVGIPEKRLHEFTAKYQGVGAAQRVVVGHSSDPEAVTVDAVTGATVTVMVVNEIIMRSAHEVAVSLGLVKA
ncbi:MAG: FMN-binding protein, partial [Halomonas sp.]|nr:FMN-binding protein [Halomonas sp.]